MSTPSVTLRSLKNVDTGIDISVPRFQEEEAPLGGISILYEISVLTTLDLFKTRLHRSEDVVHFTIYKAYREIEDLYNKLNKKYPKAGLPPVPKSSSAGKYSPDEKLEALGKFMHALAKDVQVCYSSTFTQFIGINSHRLPSFTVPNVESTDGGSSKNGTEVEKKTVDNTIEVFPKVKSAAIEKTQPVPMAKNVDLFEEVKLSTSSSLNTSKGSKGLFDDLEDDSLFSSSTPSITKVEAPKETITREMPKPEIRKPKEKNISLETIDDSQIIIKDRKIGEMSLFSEQDLGEYITKEEEALFLVTSPNTVKKKNDLLFSENEILSPETDTSLTENLDDLLDLEPLPNMPPPRKKCLDEEIIVQKPEEPVQEKELPKPEEPVQEEELPKPEEPVQEEELPKPEIKERPKPVPLPRKKSLGIMETDSQQKPEVMPRKVFLNKVTPATTADTNTRPPVPAKPIVPSKPVVAPKPKPPPKKPKPTSQTTGNKATTDLDAANANESELTENLNKVTSDLEDLDILKYIEQEEKSSDAHLSLFD